VCTRYKGFDSRGGFTSYVLGIDVGTGGTRAVVVDENGAVAGAATGEHEPFASPQNGWAEQHPEDWWKATGEAVPAALKSAGVTSGQIVCVGFSGQMHGAVLLDSADHVIRPALIWCDQRTAAECAELNAEIGLQRIIEYTCNPPLTNFTLTKLLWVRKHEPDRWSRFRRLLLPKDYVRLRLTGEYAIDVADASGTLLLDVTHRRWSEAMLSATHLERSCLPGLFESAEVCGRVSAEGAKHTGLRAGTPVVAGAGDQAAGAVGMGVVGAGTIHATIGTSGVVFAATDRPAMDPQGRLHTFCHAIPGRWHVMGVTQAAGLSLRWFRDTFGPATPDAYERLTAEAANAPAGSDGVLWAPYLMGERTPHLDPHARAALIGLTANHSRAHIVRAILEGVAFSLKDTLQIFAEMKVPVRRIRLGGGGARSPLWRQIQADIYEHEVETVAADEGAAYGAALLAGVGGGFWPDVDTACASAVKVETTVAAKKENVPALRERYAAFRRLYPALQVVERVDAANIGLARVHEKADPSLRS
jgi:xylulokinase